MAVRPHSETLGPVIPRSGAGAWHVWCVGVLGRGPAPGAVFTTLQHSSSLHYIHSTSPYPPPPTPPPAIAYTYTLHRLHMNRHMILLHGLVLMFTINYACKSNKVPVVPNMCTANCNIFCIFSGHSPFKSCYNYYIYNNYVDMNIIDGAFVYGLSPFKISRP